MSKIVVLDYGSSNLRSVAKALETVATSNQDIAITDNPKTILNALNQVEIPVYGNGKQVRDWLYVEDHVDALYTILKNGKLDCRLLYFPIREGKFH